jgi:hypothetical protein
MLMTSDNAHPRTPNVNPSHDPTPTHSPPPDPSRPDEAAGDDHGRPLTTNATAAAWYRTAQRGLARRDDPGQALRQALRADPDFAVAASDLNALTDVSPVAAARPATNWERHHCEIVGTARLDVRRASGILREHLADVGCDPLALYIVDVALSTTCHGSDPCPDLADLIASAPDCHRPAALDECDEPG